MLRVEICVNRRRLNDPGLNQGRENRRAPRRSLAAVTDRPAGLAADRLNVQVDFPRLQRLALPIPSGRTKLDSAPAQACRAAGAGLRKG